MVIVIGLDDQLNACMHRGQVPDVLTCVMPAARSASRAKPGFELPGDIKVITARQRETSGARFVSCNNESHSALSGTRCERRHHRVRRGNGCHNDGSLLPVSGL